MSDVVEIPIGHGAVLLRPATGHRLHVNRTAFEVWRELRLGTGGADVAAAVAQHHGVAPELIAGDVRAALTVLRAFADAAVDAGAGPERVAGPRAPDPGEAPPCGSGAVEQGQEVGPFAVLGHRFVVQADRPDVVDLAQSLFGSLASPRDVVTHDDRDGALVTYAIRTHLDRRLAASVWRDGLLLRSALDGRGALARLVWILNQAAVEHPTEALSFHAAAVARHDRVVVLAGESGAGKSTLAAGLVIDGFDYLGDEVTTIDHTHRVAGVPKAAGLSAQSLRAIGVDRSAAIWLDDDAHVPPDRLRPGSARPSGHLAAVVLPRFRPGAAWAETRLSPIDAVTALLPCVFGGRPFTQADADVLGSIATAVPVHRIDIPDLAAAVSFVAGLAVER